ncbi:MAG: hypothetical protein IPG89_04355 [Bacteroidetes bacterium]|nr:hypothetical protein [Bacteroidota bacterium]
MNSFLVYQISDNSINDTVKAKMKALGYYEAWSSNNINYKLPDYSMWKPNNLSLQKAVEDMQKVILEINSEKGLTVKLLRCVAVPVSPWHAITGE